MSKNPTDSEIISQLLYRAENVQILLKQYEENSVLLEAALKMAGRKKDTLIKIFSDREKWGIIEPAMEELSLLLRLLDKLADKTIT